MTSAIGAAPRFIKLFEAEMTGSPLAGADYVNDILKRAGRIDCFSDWKKIESPYYGCVVVMKTVIGFVIAANGDDVWAIDGQATRKIAAQAVDFLWPLDLPPPPRQLIAGMGRHLIA